MSPGRTVRLACLSPLVLVVALVPGRDLNPTAEAVTEPAAAAPPEFEVEKHANVAYRVGPTADPVRHRLDVYVPKGQKGFPVLLFVHGGSWKSGNKNLYAALGHAFAKAGIGVVVTNYRLSPKVRHPAHAEDVAGAFAWAHKHIAKYGGRPDRIILIGHSAGGHLAALLALDPTYLKAEGLSPENVRGVVAISGVYRIRPGADLTKAAFDPDPELCERASPLSHVTGKPPPFLIAYADKDYEEFDEMAVELNAALEKIKCPTTLVKVSHRNHVTEIITIINHDDPLHRAVREFVMKK
jgi:acetyl esterase/lipase